MVELIKIKRTPTPNNPPTGLAPGELAVEMAEPTRLWVGVPNTIDPTEKKLLIDVNAINAARAAVQVAPPAAPTQGELWYENDTGILWIWYDDGNTAQWVQVNGISASEDGGTLPIGGYVVPATPPVADGALVGFLGVDGAHIKSVEAPSDGSLYGRRNGAWDTALRTAGGTLTGPLVLPGAPAADLQAATKKYVDDLVAAAVAATIHSYPMECYLNYTGANITLNRLNGCHVTVNGVIHILPVGGVVLTPAGILNNSYYYIYLAFVAGALVLEASTTTWNTDAATGMKIKNGDPTRMLMGAVLTEGAAGAWAAGRPHTLVSLYNPKRRYYASMTNPTVNWTAFAQAPATIGYTVPNFDNRIHTLHWGFHSASHSVATAAGYFQIMTYAGTYALLSADVMTFLDPSNHVYPLTRTVNFGGQGGYGIPAAEGANNAYTLHLATSTPLWSINYLEFGIETWG